MGRDISKVSDLKNPFGLVGRGDGKLTHIKDIEKGTEVYCPNCKDRLIVRDGEKMIKHLSHKNDTGEGCHGESVIHKLTKEYLYQELQSLQVNEHKIEVVKGKFKLSDTEDLPIKHKFLEYRGLSPKYRPDIFVVLEGNYNICLEVCYKNPKNQEDLDELLPTLPIDMVIEIPVYEEDLIEFNIADIMGRTMTVYNKIDEGFTNAQNKVTNIVNKYHEILLSKNLPEYNRHIENKKFEIKLTNYRDKMLEMENSIDDKVDEIEKLKKKNGYYKEFNHCRRAIRALYKGIYTDKGFSLSSNAEACGEAIVEIAQEYDKMSKKINILANGMYSIYEILGKRGNLSYVKLYSNNPKYSDRFTKIEDAIDKIVRDIRNNDHQKKIRKYEEENKDLKRKISDNTIKINELEDNVRNISMYQIQIDIKDKEIKRLQDIIDEPNKDGYQFKLT